MKSREMHERISKFKFVLMTTGMSAKGFAEDLEEQAIMKTDVSNVRRWIRNESWPKKAVWDRLFFISEAVEGAHGYPTLPLEAETMRDAIEVRRTWTEHRRKLREDEAKAKSPTRKELSGFSRL